MSKIISRTYSERGRSNFEGINWHRDDRAAMDISPEPPAGVTTRRFTKEECDALDQADANHDDATLKRHINNCIRLAKNGNIWEGPPPHPYGTPLETLELLMTPKQVREAIFGRLTP